MGPTQSRLFLFFFFNDTATTEIYTLSLHDALPIFQQVHERWLVTARERLGERAFAGAWTSGQAMTREEAIAHALGTADRKSTRLNSSHANISYAVFCLKKKK